MVDVEVPSTLPRSPCCSDGSSQANSLWGFMFRFSACVMRESISSLGKVLILKEAIFPLERNAVPLALTVISGGAGLSFASLNALSLLQLQNRGGRSIEGFAINH
ncbi:hypothetical protein LINPERPRIM_LOCUS22216 [Linum perenne]